MPLYIELRGKIWYIRGTVSVDERSVTLQKSTRTSDKKAAEIIRARTEARLTEELLHGKEHMATFEEAMVSYLESGGSNRFMAPLAKHFGRAKLKHITQSDLDRAGRELYPTANHETRNRQCYTPFIAVWNRAVLNKWASPVKWQRPRKPKGTNVVAIKPRRAGSAPTSYDRAVQFVAAMSPAPAMVMTTLFFTGLRPIELFALQAPDVDVSGRWIVIRKTKTGEPRGVPMHEFLVPLFESLLKRPDLRKEPKLFRTHKGAPYPELDDAGGQMKAAIMGARERSGINDIAPYTGRHTVSTQLVVNGVHPYVKDQILGHAADDMSRHYTNVPQKPLIDAINGIAVPDAWRTLPWWEDPLAWSGRLFNSQEGRRIRASKKVA